MALTMTEAAKLTQDMMVAGVIETIIKESAVLRYLAWQTLTGTALTYNQENALPTSSFFDVGDTWTESTPTFTQKTAALKIMGGDADVDNFLQQTYSNVNDLQATVIASKAKAVAHSFNDKFFNGDVATNAKEFDGLDKLCASGQRATMGTNGGALTLAKLDETIDLIRPGKPHALFMSKRTRRKLKDLRRASGAVLEVAINQYGEQVVSYDGIPIEVDDFIKDDQTKGTSTNASSIYAVQFAPLTGLMGIDNGGLQVEYLGSLETKDARRTRIKWYTSLVLFRAQAVAVLDGITP